MDVFRPGISFPQEKLYQLAHHNVLIFKKCFWHALCVYPCNYKLGINIMLVKSGTEGEWRPTMQTSGATRHLALTSPGAEPSDKNQEFEPFGDDGMGFFDFLDIINPLHHLPFVGPIYRELTGDELAAGPRMMGGALYFGPIGLVGSAVDVVLEEITGDDLGGNILSAFGDDEDEADHTSTAAGTQIIEDPAETVSLQAEISDLAGPEPTDPITAWAIGELNHRNALAQNLGIGSPPQTYAHLLANTPIAHNQLKSNSTSLENGSHHTIIEQAKLTPARPDEIRRAHLAYRSAELAHSQPTTAETPSDSQAGGWFTAAMLDALEKAPPMPGPNLSQGNNATPHN
jgi:hypothetical protein